MKFMRHLYSHSVSKKGYLYRHFFKLGQTLVRVDDGVRHIMPGRGSVKVKIEALVCACM